MRHMRRGLISLGIACLLAAVAVAPVAAWITTEGTDGRDRLYGTRYQDIMRGYKGNDVIVGYGASDLLHGGSGNDRMRGGDGSDSLDGAAGNDHLRGGPGADRLDGGQGDDTLDVSGDTSVDHVLCGGGFDVVYYDAEDLVADGCETKIVVQP